MSLFILNQKVVFTNEIQPACLPPSNIDTYQYPPLNSIGAIAGWGLTNGFLYELPSDLQNVEIQVIDESINVKCSDKAIVDKSILCLSKHLEKINKQMYLYIFNF